MDALLVAAVLLLAAATPAHAAFGVSWHSPPRAVDSATPRRDPGRRAPVLRHHVVHVQHDASLGTPTANVKNVRVDVPPGPDLQPAGDAPLQQRATSPSLPGQHARSAPRDADVASGARAGRRTRAGLQHGDDREPGLGLRVRRADPRPRTDIVGGVRDTSDYGLFFTISNIPALANLVSSELDFWGVPSQHGGGASSKPFISLPTECGVQGTTTLTSSRGPAQTHDGRRPRSAPATGCDQVPFDPSIDVQPGTTQADEPTSAAVDLHVPQSYDDSTKLATAHVKDVSVTLPDGMTINPAAANGLAGCSDAVRAGPPARPAGRVDGRDLDAGAAGQADGRRLSRPAAAGRPVPALRRGAAGSASRSG